LSRTILFFSTTFKPTIIPVDSYLARNTLPNLPYPSLLMILKFSFPIPSLLGTLNLAGDLVWLRKKEGKVFSDL
jgi:hypothetical protein